MARCLFISLMFFILIGCTNKENSIVGKWESIPQHDYENHVVYIFTNDKYQVIINEEELDTPLSYTIEGDTIMLDRGKHWVPVAGRQNRYMKEAYSISKGSKGTILVLGDFLLKKVE